MKSVGDFFSRFKNLTPPDGVLKKAIAQAIYAGSRIEIKTENIRVANGIAFIRASSVAKNAIHMARARILEELAHAAPKARTEVRDIR